MAEQRRSFTIPRKLSLRHNDSTMHPIFTRVLSEITNRSKSFGTLAPGEKDEPRSSRNPYISSSKQQALTSLESCPMLHLTTDVVTLEAQRARRLWVAITITAPASAHSPHLESYNIDLEIVPSPTCTVLTVFRPDVMEIAPGQTICAAVEVFVPRWKLFHPDSASFSALELAFLDLEHFLGLAQTLLMTVHMRYQLKDADIISDVLTVSQQLQFPRTNPSSEWSKEPLVSDDDTVRRTIDVHKTVLTAIRQSLSDSYILQAMKKLIQDGNLHPLIQQDAINLEREVLSRLRTPQPTSFRPSVDKSPMNRSPSCDSTLTVLRRPESAARPAIPDNTAHRIWQLMRRDSKSKSGAAGTPVVAVTTTSPGGGALSPTTAMAAAASPALAHNRPAQMEIYARALRNQRSIGLDTLKSLTLGSEDEVKTVGKVATVPWM